MCLPAVQLTPHVQLIIGISPVGKEDDFAPSADLCGHSHAQSESRQVEGFQRDQLHITGSSLRGEHQGLDGNTLWETANSRIVKEMLARELSRAATTSVEISRS